MLERCSAFGTTTLRSTSAWSRSSRPSQTFWSAAHSRSITRHATTRPEMHQACNFIPMATTRNRGAASSRPRRALCRDPVVSNAPSTRFLYQVFSLPAACCVLRAPTDPLAAACCVLLLILLLLRATTDSLATAYYYRLSCCSFLLPNTLLQVYDNRPPYCCCLLPPTPLLLLPTTDSPPCWLPVCTYRRPVQAARSKHKLPDDLHDSGDAAVDCRLD